MSKPVPATRIKKGSGASAKKSHSFSVIIRIIFQFTKLSLLRLHAKAIVEKKFLPILNLLAKW